MMTIPRKPVSEEPGLSRGISLDLLPRIGSANALETWGAVGNVLPASQGRTGPEAEIFGFQVVHAMAKAIDAKDEYTVGHSRRVALYSRAIAERFGWNEADCVKLYHIALLHDVGKIGIPDSILNKRGHLTDLEFAKIRRHPDIGADILKEIKFLKDLELGARFHHERFDGKGYPLGLQKKEIPVVARIICVADAFDAMSSQRCYRHRLDLNASRAELLHCAGKQFDPEIVKVFLELLDAEVFGMPRKLG